MQHLQEEKAEEVPEPDISYIMQGVRENSVIEMVKVETGKLMTQAQVYRQLQIQVIDQRMLPYAQHPLLCWK